MHSKVQQHSVKPKEPSEREAEVYEDETEEKQELIEKEESVKEESVKGESVKEESVKEESVKEESVKEESIKGEDPFYEENDFDDEPVSKEDEHNSLLNKSNHSLGEDAVEEGFSQKEPQEDTETKKEDPFEEDKPAKSNKAADLFASMKGQQALFPSRQPVKQDKVAVKPVSTPLKKENKSKSNPFSKNNDNLFGAKPGSGGKKNPFAK